MVATHPQVVTSDIQRQQIAHSRQSIYLLSQPLLEICVTLNVPLSELKYTTAIAIGTDHMV